VFIPLIGKGGVNVLLNIISKGALATVIPLNCSLADRQFKFPGSRNPWMTVDIRFSLDQESTREAC